MRQPFDLIAETTAIDAKRKAAGEVSSGLSEIWLPYYRNLQYANSFLIVLTGVMLFIPVFVVTGNYMPAYIAALLIFLNVEANELRHEILSDYFAMAITAGAMLCFAFAFVRHWRVGWLLTGLALAALSLTKAVYFYFAVPLLIAASAVSLRNSAVRLQLPALANNLRNFLRTRAIRIPGVGLRGAAQGGTELTVS